MAAIIKKTKDRKTDDMVTDSLKPFNVVSGRLKLRFIPDTGGFAVVGVGIRGLNTQGDIFEEALANAHDAAKLLEECEKEMRFAPLTEGAYRWKKGCLAKPVKKSPCLASAVCAFR